MMAKRKPKQRTAIEYTDGPTEAQQANGDYASVLLPDPHLNRTARVHVNRGGTPLARWIAAGKLTEGHQRAIDYVLRLWRLTGIHQRVTASYGERMPCSSTDADHRATSAIEAREDLHRIQDMFPAQYWAVFENCCRFDIPAGVAGGNLGYGGRDSDVRAHMIVATLADFIAMRENL